jgi:hypothetical protein
MRQAQLYPPIRRELGAILGTYVRPPDILPPELGNRAGVLGALVPAEMAGA